MINIAIVEDSKEDMLLLKNYIQRYSQEHQMSFHTDTFCDGIDIVSDYTPCYDIIFLDIQMKHLDGMTTAEKIRALDEETEFIFITSTTQYAIQGYTVNAMGYILKPVSYLAFAQIFAKGISKAEAKHQRGYFSFDAEHGAVKLELRQIYYIESQLHHILVHSVKGVFKTAGPMKKAEKALADKGFAKCHNAYLLNLYHVDFAGQNTVTLTDNTRLPVSRTRKKEFLEALTNYLGGVQC